MGLWEKFAAGLGLGRSGDTLSKPQSPVYRGIPEPSLRTSPPNRMGSRSNERPIKRVNIGLDFGTSTTKVIVRIDEAAGKPIFVTVGPSDQKGTVLFPSVTAVADGTILFGHAAAASESTVKATSFKMNLPAEAGSRQHSWRGRLRFGDTGLLAEELSTLYLAWVLGDVLKRLRTTVGGADLKVTVNAAAPLDQMREETSLRDLFHRIIYRSLKIQHLSVARWPLDAARVALRQIAAEAIPSDEDSPVSVFPETHAAMTSYILVPGRARGKYATVDVGAGSTDVAFFWFHNPDGRYAEGPPEMCYYGAASAFVGMDDIDRAVASHHGLSKFDAKNKREAGHVMLDDINEAGTSFENMYECYRMGFGESYKRCLGEYEWRFRGPGESGSRCPKDGHARFTLCLVGGGSLSPELTRKLCRTFPLQGIRTIDVEVLRVPDELPVLKAGGFASIASVAPREQPLLVLAHGLANRAVDIPSFTADHRFERVRTMPDRPTHEEIYAK